MLDKNRDNDNMFNASKKRPASSRRTIRASKEEFLHLQSRSKQLPLTTRASPSDPVLTLSSPSSLLLVSSSSSSLQTPWSLSFSPKTLSVESIQTTPARTAVATTTTATTKGRLQESSKAINILVGRTKLLQQHYRQQQQQKYHKHYYHHHHYTPQWRFRPLPGIKATSFFTILTLVCLETVLLSTVSNCAKTFYMHWNTSNSIFRIDNTDHIIDVNKGNPAFEFDQVHIICPVYEPGTFENETEKYIIYNVSKVEYETCRITNADPRVIAICDKPQKLMFFTITFRPFTPQPGGLEFLPGNDYYFISTSSKDDLYRRIGGRCSTNNMKVVFKVCCAPENKNNRTNNINGGGSGSEIVNSGGGSGSSSTAIQQQHNNNININGGSGQLPSPKIPSMNGDMGIGGMSNGGGLMINSNSGTSINTNIDQFNRMPMQQSNNIGGIGMGMGGIESGGSINGQQTGMRINNIPSSQQYPPQKNGMQGVFISPIATNSSNIVQSTISWPNWGNHNNYNGERDQGESDDGSGNSIVGSINVQQHSTPVSSNGVQHPSINRAVNNNSIYSPSHKPTKNTTEYDKHPNEVVKNEELTYNSGASSLSYKIAQRRTVLALRTTAHYTNISTFENICRKFRSLLRLLLFTSNQQNRLNTINLLFHFIFNCNPIIIITTVLVTLTNLFQYKLTLWNLQLCFTAPSMRVNKKTVRKAQIPGTTTTTYGRLVQTTSSVACLRTSSSNELRTLSPASLNQSAFILLPSDYMEKAVTPSSNTLNINTPIR